MTDIIRPGSPTGNAPMVTNALQPPGGNILMQPWVWRGRITRHDLTAAATSQSLNLRTLFATQRTQGSRIEGANPVRDEIYAGLLYINLVEVFAGGGAANANVIVGRTGDTDAYLTTSSIFTGATLQNIGTPAAAEYPLRQFGAGVSGAAGGQFTPLVEISSSVNVNTLTSGILDVCFMYWLLPTRRTG